MKKLSFITVFVFLSILFVQAQQAKYVFYFIGDGMGVNQVLGTEMYRGELEGKIGVTPLLFTQFPYATIATTFSATNGVTDSAAAGTALATGNKTKNGALGVKKDLETKVNSVASWAKNKGCRVGNQYQCQRRPCHTGCFLRTPRTKKQLLQRGSGFD